MAKRSKFSVDMQFLFGDALIKSGVATVWLAALFAAGFVSAIPEEVGRHAIGFWGMIAAMVVLAAGLWQLGRALRKEATIADR
jgi:hypothetical protein